MPRAPSRHVDDPDAVGHRLREARLRHGFSQRELAFPGCTPAYISRIEAGERIPSLHLLHELGRRLGVSPDYLAWGGERQGEHEQSLAIACQTRLALDALADGITRAQSLLDDVVAGACLPRADGDPESA